MSLNRLISDEVDQLVLLRKNGSKVFKIASIVIDEDLFSKIKDSVSFIKQKNASSIVFKLENPPKIYRSRNISDDNEKFINDFLDSKKKSRLTICLSDPRFKNLEEIVVNSLNVMDVEEHPEVTISFVSKHWVLKYRAEFFDIDCLVKKHKLK